MPPPNPKNSALSGAATDLGLDGNLDEELTDEEERKKRLAEKKSTLPSLFGDQTLGNAAMMLFGSK